MGNEKLIGWLGSSKKKLKEFSTVIQKMIGYSLHLAQNGKEDVDAKPLKGFGSAKIREIIKNDTDSTYRAVYTIEFSEIIYVLHVFKKKSKTGIETPKHEIELIKTRLKEAKNKYKERKK